MERFLLCPHTIKPLVCTRVFIKLVIRHNYPIKVVNYTFNIANNNNNKAIWSNNPTRIVRKYKHHTYTMYVAYNSLNVCNLHALLAHWNAISIAFKMNIQWMPSQKTHHTAAPLAVRGLHWFNSRISTHLFTTSSRRREVYYNMYREKRKHDKIWSFMSKRLT